VRVNAYTDLRVIAEISDGNIYMVNNYVKASGLGDLLSTQLLIKHPNSSGLQFDQISRQYIPANFIRSIQVTFNDEVVFTADSDISISEDPSIHFGFRPEEEGVLKVEVKDSTGRTFNHSVDLPNQEKG
ncbi:MAG: thiosulfate oxidation carrier complex protein SoxZ, partial [Candidatus Thiodiazotropha sp. (ex Cardiolucina cf. quadrata)]|nr:thiosulfate oxidation carrier complex protein SoxZ [Candidatus Thiodiazotropha sp. (ex Cardiolucina cf. quadrata)]